MSKQIGVPLSSDEIPAGTGLVQTIECTGANIKEPLELPILAQITTYSDGIRRVCCPHKNQIHPDEKGALCSLSTGKKCMYDWADPK